MTRRSMLHRADDVEFISGLDYIRRSVDVDFTCAFVIVDNNSRIVSRCSNTKQRIYLILRQRRKFGAVPSQRFK